MSKSAAESNDARTWTLERLGWVRYRVTISIAGKDSCSSFWAWSQSSASDQGLSKFKQACSSEQAANTACACGNNPLLGLDLQTGQCKCCREGHLFYHDDTHCRRCPIPREAAFPY